MLSDLLKENKGIPLLLFFLFGVLLCQPTEVFGQLTYYSRGSGNWNDVNTWSVENHAGAQAPQIPGNAPGIASADQIIIAANHSITLDIDRQVASLTIGTVDGPGILIIGDNNLSRNLVVDGAVLLGTNGILQRNTTQTEGVHSLKITGDNGNLTNHGIIHFTDVTEPAIGWSTVDVWLETGGNVTMNGSATAANSLLNSLTINKNNRAIKLGSSWRVAKTLSIQAGSLELGDATTQYTINGAASASNIRIDINGIIRLFGTANFPTGYLSTIDGTDGTVEYAGTNQTVATTSQVESFPNLLFSGSGTKTLGSSILVTNNLTINTGCTFIANGYNIELKGNYLNAGTFTPGTSLFTFSGNENQTISGTANFSNLTINKPIAGTSVFANSPLSVSLATSLAQGTLDVGMLTTHNLGTVSGTGTLALSATEAGTTSFPLGVWTGFLTGANAGVVAYNGTTNYFIGQSGMNGATELNYAHLKIAGNSIKTLSFPTSIDKNISIGLGSTLNTSNRTVTLGGNFLNDGTFTSTGTVNFISTVAAQSISGLSTTTFNHLTLSKAFGKNLTLSSSIQVNGLLALTNEGFLVLNDKNLTVGPLGSITGNAGGTDTTAFNNRRMIQQDGTNSSNGLVIKEGTTTAQLTKVFPVGTGTIYSAADVRLLTATITGTASISIKTVPFTSGNANLVKRYWRVQSNSISNITDARLLFHFALPSGTPTLVSRYANGLENTVLGSFVNTTTFTFGVNAAGNKYLDLEWRAGDNASFSKTYYSYQSGSWDIPNNWTTDPTGTILQGQPATGGPTNGDQVFILNGRKINMATNGKILTSVEIQAGGTLDVLATTGHNLGKMSGAGLLRIATISIPTAIWTDFVSSVGGTIEYYDYSGALSTNIPYYNNLIMSGTGTKIVGVLGAPPGFTVNIRINGSLTVKSGTLQLGSDGKAKLKIAVYGNVTVDAAATVTVNNVSPNQIHELTYYGNLVNNGIINLCNTPQYSTANSGAVSLTMSGASNNSISGTGSQFDIYKLIVDKGVDQTYVLDVNATNMKLFAPTNLANGSITAPYSQENPEILKALWIKNGTLKLGSNVVIDELTSGGNDFFIPEKGAMLLNGATVSSLRAGATSPGNTALTLYGKLRVSSGQWNGNKSAGIVYRTISELIVEGGTVIISQFRASGLGTGPANNRSAYVQTGGTVIVNGLGEKGGGALFSLDKTSSVFRMSGGTLQVTENTSAGAIDIRADVSNFEVTGGLIEIKTNTISGTPDYLVSSTVPFYDFQVTPGTGGGNIKLSAFPLTVLNDFTIGTGKTFDANNLNLTIGRHYSNAGTYTTGTNTTIFNGSLTSQTLTSTSAIVFNHLTINNTFANGSVNLPGPSGTTTINGNLTLTAGTFDDGGQTVHVKGNVANSSTHTGTGKIRLNNSVATVMLISGSGTGIFTNLELDDTDGVTFTADQTVNGTFTLTNGVLDIKQHNLMLGTSASIAVSSPSVTKMIRTSGIRSDKGISKAFGSAGTFTYPLGIPGKYSPATIQVVSASVMGTLTINPVAQRLAYTTSTNALNMFWKVEATTGFTGTNNFSYSFAYDPTLVSGTEANYLARYHDPNVLANWSAGTSVNASTHVINFTNVDYLAGEYTAGELNAFNTIVVFYSRVNGNWETPSTWSNTGVGGSAAATTPISSSPVVIGDGNTNNHVVTITTNTRTAASLEINNGSTLDLGTTTGHNFGALTGSTASRPVAGTGKLRISSSSATAQFPAGDFADFLGAGGGTVEYYVAVSTNFSLPLTSAAPTSLSLGSYNNLTISHGAFTITLPDRDLIIYNDFSVNAGSGKALLSNTTIGIGNVDIRGDMTIAGTFQYQNTRMRTVTVGRKLTVASTGNVSVSTTGTAIANWLYLKGDMENNGTFNLNEGTRLCDVMFTGTTNNSMTGTGSITDFNRLLVNKGNAANVILEANLTNLTLSASSSATNKSLEIQNGTFKLSSTQNLIISSAANGSNFFIPYSGGLWVNGGTMRITATGTGAGLLLAGKLTVSSGSMLIEGGGTNDNYIEIAGAGSPTIEVVGGTLRVGSQIRRANTSTISALTYLQSGGAVTVGTQAAPTSNRALLEVLNSGSSFIMSGGTLSIARHQTAPATIAALYLQPSTFAVSGGTIELGSNSYTPAGQNIQFYSSGPLWDLSINATNNPTATLAVSALTVKNSLTVGGGTTTFNANDFDVSLEGNLTVNGIYTSGNNTTYFKSANKSQSLNGTSLITFNNLAINNTLTAGTVTLGTDIAVLKTLDLIAGTLADNNKEIHAKARVNNYSTHLSSGATGRIIFDGSTQQILAGDGTGVWGNIELNNSKGVLLETRQNLEGKITLTNGIMDIRAIPLVLGENVTIAGTPGILNMIRTNGTLSDAGIQKRFNAGLFNFTFPIGSSDKYTPVQLISTANTAAGSVTIKPVNRIHPSVQGSDALKYYWNVSSTGFAGLVMKHYYSYDVADVVGDENTYVVARFTNNWTKGLGIGNLNTSSHLITIDGGTSGVNYLNGDFTTGTTLSFISVTSYVTAQSGDWDTGATWVGGVVPTPGNPLTINANHLITITANGGNPAPNSKTAFSLEIKNGAKLTIDNTTYGHNLGNVSGTGTLSLSGNIFPGGAFDQFVSSSGGTVEFTGAGYTLPVQPFFNHLSINSSGTLTAANLDISLNGNLTLTAGVLDGSVNNKSIWLRGNWLNNASTSAFTPGTGFVGFIGANSQSMGGTYQTSFYNLEVNKSSNAVSLSNDLPATNLIKFTKGNIVTNSYKVLASASIAINHQSGHVVGNFSKMVGTSAMLFPVGTTSSYLPLRINFTSGSSEITVSVAGTNPCLAKGAGDDTNPLVAMWSIHATAFPVSAQAKVVFQYPDNVRQIGFQQNQAFAARWNTTTTAWQSFRTLSTSSPDEDPSTVTATGITQFSDWTIFNATTDNIVLPITLLDFSGKLEGEQVRLNWTTTSQINNDYFELQRASESLHFEAIGRITGAGNSREVLKYDFLDENPLSGTNYYRLKQVDTDRKYSYSKVISVKGDAPSTLDLIVFPNPAHAFEVQLRLIGWGEQPAHVEVIDVLGNRIFSQTWVGQETNHDMALNEYRTLPAGIYTVLVSNQKQLLKRRLVIH